MIRVTVELIPFGNESESKVIAEAVIANRENFSNNTANYNCWLTTVEETPRYAEVILHDRSMGVWQLIKSMLKARPQRPPDNLQANLLRKKLKCKSLK
jgi:hypothetical protein